MRQLKLFGGAVVEDEHGTVPGLNARRHPLALLALLATAPTRTVSRGKLVGMLWPEVREKVARNRLTSCLYDVRSALGDQVVLTLGSDLRLDTDALTSDTGRFEAALQAAAYQRAVALYDGPFLDGFWLRDSPEFDQWVERERDRLRRGYLAALEALAAAAEVRGEFDVAIEWWRRRAAEDPYDSRVTRRLMEMLAAAGSRAEALRVAREHERVLDEEFGAGPDADLEALVNRLLQPPSPSAPARSSGVAPEMGTPLIEGADEFPASSVAVLPFQNLSGLEDTEPLTMGLHDDVLTELSRSPVLTVISRTSVLRYRGSNKSIQQIARELGVGTIVEGGVQSAGGRLRLNVQLIDARTDAHRWVERYDRELSTGSILEIQTELAQKIAQSLHAELTPAQPGAGHQSTTASLEAYRLCAQGRRLRDQRTEDGMRRAVAYFERALELDAEYADAWVGLGAALSLLHDYGYEDGERMLPRAESALRRALELDPTLPDAYGALGEFHTAARDWSAAEQELLRAIELRPGYAEAHNWLSWIYLVTGSGEAAAEHALHAVELDPLAPEAVSNLALSSLANGQPQRALQEARRVRELQPDWTSGPFYEALALYHLGRYAEASALLENLTVEWAGSGPQLTLALACVGAGDTGRARALLDTFVAGDDRYAAGVVYLALGETGRAFELLRTANCARYWPRLSLNFLYPEVLAPLRAEPLYRVMLGA
jgi:DNA-binding SARP family transcriptional activator/Flp pilus assembly protein TadD